MKFSISSSDIECSISSNTRVSQRTATVTRANYSARFCGLKNWIDYLVLVDVHRSQVTIEEQLVRLDVDGALPSSLAA